MSLYESIKKNLNEADGYVFRGYDYWGSKYGSSVDGECIIQFYDGPGKLEYLCKAKNGKFVWRDSSRVDSEPYVFSSYDEALKKQKELGGEILDYKHEYLGEPDDKDPDAFNETEKNLNEADYNVLDVSSFDNYPFEILEFKVNTPDGVVYLDMDKSSYRNKDSFEDASVWLFSVPFNKGLVTVDEDSGAVDFDYSSYDISDRADCETIYNVCLGHNVDLSEGDTFTFDPDLVAKVKAEYDKDKPILIKQLKEEFRGVVRSLLSAGFTKDEILKLPETKAYSDAIKDPDDIWCDCGSTADGKYKEDGAVYLGVEKHGWICPKCKKFKQIG